MQKFSATHTEFRFLHVIASEAKQSRAAHAEGLDCFVASAPRNDGREVRAPDAAQRAASSRRGALQSLKRVYARPRRAMAPVVNIVKRGPGSAKHRFARATRCIAPGTQEKEKPRPVGKPERGS